MMALLYGEWKVEGLATMKDPNRGLYIPIMAFFTEMELFCRTVASFPSRHQDPDDFRSDHVGRRYYTDGNDGRYFVDLDEGKFGTLTQEEFDRAIKPDRIPEMD